MNRLNQLVAGSAQAMAFRDLPTAHQLAVIYWMSVNGEAWEPLFDVRAEDEAAFKASLLASLPAYVRDHGDMVWNVALLPAARLKEAVMADPEIAESHATWDDYAAWYAEATDVPDHGPDERWPVILSDDDEETLMDGWHRLHSYLRAGHADIPCVF